MTVIAETKDTICQMCRFVSRERLNMWLLAMFAFMMMAAPSIKAQDVAAAGEAYVAASEAFENGKYQTALEKIAVVEQAMGKTAQTRYISIVSYYKLGDYENCIAATREYQQNPPDDDGNAAEIRRLYADAQTKVQKQLADREAKAAEQRRQEAERKRQEEVARQKAAFEREAAEKWETLKTSEDLSALQAFIGKYKGTPSETVAQKRYADEQAWKKAATDNTIEGYERYLDGNTLKNHRRDATEILEYNYARLCKKNAEEGKIETAEDMYRRYTAMFPQGKDKAGLQKALCDVYFAKGKKLVKSRETSDIYKGMELLKQSEKYNCPNAAEITKTYKKANSRYNYLRVAGRGRFFIGYSGDLQSPAGITLGGLARGPRPYFTFRTNTAFFKQTADSKFPEDLNQEPRKVYNTHDGQTYISDSKVYNSRTPLETVTANTQIVAGLTQQVAYPLYIYAGGGLYFCKNKYKFSGKEYPRYAMNKYTGLNGTVYEYGYDGSVTDFEEWYANEENEGTGDSKTLFGMLDAGVILQFSAFYVNGGIRTNFQSEGAQFTFGVGFAF